LKVSKEIYLIFTVFFRIIKYECCINQNKISKEVFEETLERIFKIKLKNGKKNYQILDLMKKNMENNNKIKSKKEIKKYINYFLKEF